ncbi:MAG: hypothetical protein GY948_13905 [Alphaproteobacteria bacterium]|nr:hypothetical protein [Alphaproteobacteria bacterium]
MSKTELTDFAQRERNYIEIRCKLPFESITAPESEFKLFEARMKAIDCLEKLYEEMERELESTRSILERINQSAFGATDNDAVSETPRRTQAIRPVQSRRQLKAA